MPITGGHRDSGDKSSLRNVLCEALAEGPGVDPSISRLGLRAFNPVSWSMASPAPALTLPVKLERS
jgi:hypothetical protein